MKTRTWRLRAALLTGLAMTLGLAAGCGEDAVIGSDLDPGAQIPEMSIDLSAEDGGMSATAESPAFGDAYFETYMNEDEKVLGDPLAADANLDAAERHAGATVRYLRVVWGNMQNAPQLSDAVRPDRLIDWTGLAEVTDGLLIPVRTIRFERNDYILPPWKSETPSRQKVEWVSHTGSHVDGIVFKIVVPAATDPSLTTLRTNTPSDGLTADDAFMFKTGPLQTRFSIDSIADLDQVIRIDDENAVSFTGFAPDDIDRCPRGVMVGAWVQAQGDDANGGYFRAKWVGAGGRLLGHVRGRYGVLEDGSQVFVGKIIGRAGEYMGHLRGTYEGSGDDPRQGTFQGGWVIMNAEGDPRAKGEIRGKWAASPRIDHGGFLKAVWKMNCGGDNPTVEPAE